MMLQGSVSLPLWTLYEPKINLEGKRRRFIGWRVSPARAKKRVLIACLTDENHGGNKSTIPLLDELLNPEKQIKQLERASSFWWNRQVLSQNFSKWLKYSDVKYANFV